MSFCEIVDLLIKGIPAKYAHIEFVPPQGVRDSAKRGLELRREHKRGGFSTQQAGKHGIGSGVQRASNLQRGDRMSPSTVKRMHAFFSRHRAYNKYHDDKTSSAYISWMLWGGDEGQRWAQKIVNQMKRADEENK